MILLCDLSANLIGKVVTLTINSNFLQKSSSADLVIRQILLLLLNVFVNAPFVDVWRSNRGSGWYSLVVTQLSTNHQLLYVQVYVFACNCFVWYLLQQSILLTR